MDRSTVSGKAGASGRKLARARKAATLQLSMWGACPLAVAAARLGVGKISAALVMILIAAPFFVAAKHTWRRASHGTVGAKFEEETLKALSRMRTWAIVNGGDLGIPGDADHVVLGPNFAPVVVETKAGGGQVRMKGNRIVTGQGRTIPGDPIRQVTRQAEALTRIAHQRATPIICVPWMRNAAFEHDGVWICSASELPRVIGARARGGLSVEQADRIVARIEKRRRR